MNDPDWTSEYYEILTFYYWEPQHLGRSKSANCRYNKVSEALKHVQNLEVSLNHMFNIFFRLAPEGVISEMASTLTGMPVTQPLELLNRRRVETICQLVQPDLLLQGDTINLSVEMKIGAKTNLEQVWKYALLHWLADNNDQKRRDSILLYIGKATYPALWKDNHGAPADTVRLAASFDTQNLHRKAIQAEKVWVDWDAVTEKLKNTRILFCTYNDFSIFLNKKLEGHNGCKGPAESFFALVKGP